MSDQHRPKRESMSIEEATISNMWEIAAIVEVQMMGGSDDNHSNERHAANSLEGFSEGSS